MSHTRAFRVVFSAALAFYSSVQSHAQSMGEFPPGSLPEIENLPPGRFQNELKNLPPAARERAKSWLRDIHFTGHDVESMHTDSSGGICFACKFSPPPAGEIEAGDTEATSSGNPVPALAAVNVSPFPDRLKFSSRPGAANVIYINFSGQVVEGTEWNTAINRTSIPAMPFSTDSDYSTFSDA